MPHDVIMPKLGATMEEGTLLRWMRRVGEPFKKGDPLFEVQTDKVNMEIEAPSDGVLSRILCEPGSSAKVGESIALIAAPGERVEAPHPGPTVAVVGVTASGPPATPAVGRGSERQPATSGEGRIASSPSARRLALERGVDIARAGIRGSGPGGRIVERDVQRYQEASGGAAATGGSGLRPATPAAVGAGRPLPPANLVPLSPARRVTAQRMAESARTIPHFYLTIDVRAQALVAARDRLPASAPPGVRVSYTDLLVKAVAVTLVKHPVLNASWEDGQLRMNVEVHVGVAMASGDGLRVPVIRRADTLAVADIAHRRAELEGRSAEGKLTLPDLEGATFTISNLGMFGIDRFQPIINPPQAAILAVGRISERAVAENGQVAARPVLTLTLGVDHRVSDGADAARFLQDLRAELEGGESLGIAQK